MQDMGKKCAFDCYVFDKLCCSSDESGIPSLVDQGHDVVPLAEFAAYSSPSYSNMAQQYAQGDTYSTPSFGQLPLTQFQRQISPSLSVTHPEQGQSDQCLSVYLNAITPHSRFPATVPEACRRRIQRHRKRAMSYNHLSTNFGPAASSLARNTNIAGASDLQFLLEKELKPSDVGSLGRIILPKRQAEEKLPHLEAKEGVKIPFQDLQTSEIWELRFRFWPNNKTRMYLLESTGNFVKSHHLQEGDFIVLYRNSATGAYMINAKKAAWLKCSAMSERTGFLAPSGSDKYSLEPVVSMAKAPENESASTAQLSITVDEGNGSNIEDTDLMASDLWDPDELIKGLCDIEDSGRSIDELFDFKE